MSISARMAWTALIIVVSTIAFNHLHDCHAGWVLQTYLISTIAIFGLSIICDGCIIHTSLKGSITEANKRKPIGTFLSTKFILSIIQIASSIFGLITLAYGSSLPCDESSQASLLSRVFVGVVAVSQIIDSSILFCCCYLLQASSSYSSGSNKQKVDDYEPNDDELEHRTISASRNSGLPNPSLADATMAEDRILELWERRCQSFVKVFHILCCNTFGGGNIEEGFDQVAKLLTTFFHHDGFLDVVASDVVAGILLVRVEHRAKCRLLKTRFKEEVLEIALTSLRPSSERLDRTAVITQPSSSAANNTHSTPEGKNNNTSQKIHHNTAHSPGHRENSEERIITDDTDLELGPKRTNSRYVIEDEETASTPSANPYTNNPSYQPFNNYSNNSNNNPTNRIEIASLQQGFSMVEIDNWFRCAVFSLAMYTHLMVLYMHPLSGCCRMSCGGCLSATCGVCGSMGSGLCCDSDSSRGRASHSNPVRNAFKALIEGDNCCSFNYQGMNALLRNDLGRTELIYVSYKNTARFKPYAVFLDHEKEWVVIALRGTLSLEDCITDATADPVEMTQAGEKWGFDGRGQWAHGGMLLAAMNVRQELEKSGVLKQIYGYSSAGGAGGATGTSSGNINTPLNEGTVYSNYKLIVTGHSLGAGTAVILSYLLKPQYPSLHCYAYGTPGSVVDEQTSLSIASYVTSVALGNDLICRLNVHSMFTLRNDILLAISRAKVNKMYVMKAMFSDFQPDELMYPKGQEPESEFKKSVYKFIDTMNRRLEKYNDRKLCIPGRVIHFVKVRRDKKQWCNAPPRYFPINSNLHEFKDLVVSSTMGADHFPDQYYYELKKVRDYFLRSGFDA